MSEPAEPSADRAFVAALPALAMFAFFFLAQLTVAPLLQLANLGFGLAFAGVFLLAAPAVVYLRGRNLRALPFLGLRPAPPLAIALGAATGVANFFVSGTLQMLARQLFPRELLEKFDVSHVFRNAEGVDLALVVFAIGFTAPLCEEIAFRGFLQPVFRARYGRLLGVIVTASLFSFLHLDPVGFVARVELGVLFGLLAVWSGSLWPAIAAHAANNLIGTGLLVYSVTGGKVESDPSPSTTAALVAVSLLATAGALTAFRKQVPRAEETARVEPVDGGPGQAFDRRRGWDVALNFLLPALGSVLLLFAVDWRGVSLSYTEAATPGGELAQRIPDKAAREAVFDKLRDARRRARRGEVPLERYRALRKELWGPAKKEQDAPPLTPDQIDAAFRAFEQAPQSS